MELGNKRVVVDITFNCCSWRYDEKVVTGKTKSRKFVNGKRKMLLDIRNCDNINT